MSKQLDLDSLDGILPLAGAAKVSPPEVTVQATIPVELPRREATSAPAREVSLPTIRVEPPPREEEGPVDTVVVPLSMPPPQPAARRWPWVVLGAAAVGLLAVVLVTITGRGGDSGQEAAAAPSLPPSPAVATPMPVAVAEEVPVRMPEVAPPPAEVAVEPSPSVAQAEPQRAATAAPSAPPRLGGGPMSFPASFLHDEVDPASIDQAGIAEVKQWLAACSGVVSVVGHTSSVGSSEANYHVGLGRALAVRRYLLAQLQVHRRIRVESRGASEPLATNSSADGRTANRRVVLMCQ